jgi:hypothetical protein
MLDLMDSIRSHKEAITVEEGLEARLHHGVEWIPAKQCKLQTGDVYAVRKESTGTGDHRHECLCIYTGAGWVDAFGGPLGDCLQGESLMVWDFPTEEPYEEPLPELGDGGMATSLHIFLLVALSVASVWYAWWSHHQCF